MSRNRLANASSPYLRQHKDNPVHWQPWDEEAFSQAEREDKPIFLSIGYSSCHWCHVMEHESFESEEIARILNDNFVSIKVDREERPDVDETYMAAVQMSSGHGGWPMSLFLTPERKPFFAGTYFPVEDRGQYAGFRTIATQIATAWKTRKPALMKAADDFAEALRQAMQMEAPESSGQLSPSLIDAAVFQMKRRFDHKYGGFEGHPKFPPHQALSLLIYLARKEWRKDCLEILTRTLDAMMLGGIQDHVGGGFHRYSTDEKWLLPHFEKMLYDNALMLKNYADGFALTKNPEYKRVCDRLIDWLERELLSPEGMYFSALDADSEGEEGKFYTWTWTEAASVCSPEFLEAFQFRKEGNFDDEATVEPSGKNIPHLRGAHGDKWDGELKRLLELRAKRVRPGLDDKVLVAWNGLAISGLAAAGRIDLASRIADTVLALGEVPHQMRGGKPFLDIAYFIEGLLDLAEASGKESYAEEARRTFEIARKQFRDEQNGGWFFSGVEHEELFGRSKSAFDSALPSPNGVIVRCALRLGYMDIVRQDLRAMLGWMERAPLATESLLLAAAMYLDCEAKPIASKVVFRLEPKEAQVTDGMASYMLVISIPEGNHINSSRPPEDYLIPTNVEVSGFSHAKARVPDTREALTGDVPIEISGEPPAGQEGEGKATITYQMCTETECHAPETKDLRLAWHR